MGQLHEENEEEENGSKAQEEQKRNYRLGGFYAQAQFILFYWVLSLLKPSRPKAMLDSSSLL